MKEIIYANQRLINSFLSQIDNGLATNSKVASETSESNSENRKESVDGRIGFSAALQANMNKKNESSSSSQLTKSDSEYLDTVLDDYSLDLLIDKLKDTTLTKISDSRQGDFVKVNKDFSILDFEIIKNITSDNKLTDLMFGTDEDVQKLEKLKNLPKKQRTNTQQQISGLESKIEEKGINKTKKLIDMISMFSNLYESAIPNTILFSSSDSIILADRNYFRINQSEITVLSQSTRKISVFGIISNVKGEMTDGLLNGVNDIEISKINPFFMDTLLGSLGLLKQGDRFINPIAIFYE